MTRGRGLGGRLVPSGQGSHSLDLEGEERDEPRLFASCEAAEAAFLFVIRHPDFPNGSGQIENQVAARRSHASVASAQVKSSGANVGSSIRRRCPEAKRTQAVRQ